MNYKCLLNLITQSFAIAMENENYKIELFSGKKPYNYFLPQTIPVQIRPTWFVEIFINNICVWREFKIMKDDSNYKEIEEELSKRIFFSITAIGFLQNYKITNELRRRR